LKPLIKISLLLFISLGIVSAAEIPKPLAKVIWNQLPKNFVEYKKQKKGSIWESSSLQIIEGKYSIEVGSCYYTNGNIIRNMAKEDDVPDYYMIEILAPNRIGKSVVSSLRIPMSLVTKERINAKAPKIVSFDPKTGIATINLGKSIFKCRIIIQRLT